MRIGLVGLGRMGTAILPHLIRDSASVTVWNRTSAKLARAETLGAKVARTPQELVDHSDIVLSILYDDAAVEAVYFGAAGLLSGDCSNRLFVEMSTIRLDTLEKLALAASERGAALIDAPVSGSVGPAREGKLLVLAGGADADVERATPILRKFARRIAHLGPFGSGMALKLGIQELIYVYWQALAEALAIGQQKGLQLATMLEVIADSPAALAALKSKIPAITGTDKEVSFAIAAAAKDLDVILGSGRSLEVSQPITGMTFERYKRAIAAGLGNDDIAALVPFSMTDRS